jgi:sulfur carrier protein
MIIRERTSGSNVQHRIAGLSLRSMKICVNGEEVVVDHPLNVRELLARCNPGIAACAVEVNRQLVPRKRHEERMLTEGDQVEIVTLVGGG